MTFKIYVVGTESEVTAVLLWKRIKTVEIEKQQLLFLFDHIVTTNQFYLESHLMFFVRLACNIGYIFVHLLASVLANVLGMKFEPFY